jgi:Spy/CpxP family protein refolding chaperone
MTLVSRLKSAPLLKLGASSVKPQENMKLQFTALAAVAAIALIGPSVAAFPTQTRNATSYYESIGIRLTAAQKAKIAAIEADALKKIDLVYSAEQRATIADARTTMQNIQLSAAQKQKLSQYTSDPRKDLNSILTAEQQQQLRQNHRDKKVGLAFNHLGSPAEMLKAQGISLTADQESQLTELHNKRRASVDAIYTPDQLTKLQAARTKLESIQLTSEQAEQIAAIRQAAWKAKEDVLTPVQKQKLARS